MKKSLINKEELLKDYKEGMTRANLILKYKIGYQRLMKILNTTSKEYNRISYLGMTVREFQKKHNINTYKNAWHTIKKLKDKEGIYEHEFKFNSYKPACFLPENWDADSHKFQYKIDYIRG